MTKKHIALSLLLATAIPACLHAQDTYLNNRMLNGTGDIYGSARYVGMGGSMGALGADISTMSFNPAGIALMRRNDVSFTAGAIWNSAASSLSSNTHATLDQMGFVITMPSSDDMVINFGFNYQKKANYNHAFEFANAPLNGLSQMDMMAELVNGGFAMKYNLAGLALDPYDDKKGDFDKGFKDSYLTPVQSTKDPSKVDHYYNKYDGEKYQYAERTWGSLQGFDIDIAVNMEDRLYMGFDLGCDNVDYHALTKYSEFCSYNDNGTYKPGDYTLNNDVKVSGWGINFKAGIIARPFDESPFRMGLAVETPTWFSLRNSTYYQLWDDTEKRGTNQFESFLKYRLTTPWRVRASIGSTVGSNFAWNVDYELAHWSGTTQRYGEGGYSDEDPGMTDHMKQNLATVHNLRAGIEFKPTAKWALRVGYSYATSPMKSNVSYDQYYIDSYAMDYSTSTNYMRLGDSNTITLGTGYKGKNFYFDLAYKLRAQRADFYAFDSSFSQDKTFALHAPESKGHQLAPVEANLTTHQVTATLGVRF